MPGPHVPHIVTIFRSRLRPDVANDYPDVAAQLLERAKGIPGFVSFEQFTAADGERLSLIRFASDEAQSAWRDDVEHRAAQARHSDFYDCFEIVVCEEVRRSAWRREDATG